MVSYLRQNGNIAKTKGVKMETFVLTLFWIMVVQFLFTAIVLSLSEYPRVQEYEIQADVIRFIIKMIFIAWAAYLLLGV